MKILIQKKIIISIIDKIYSYHTPPRGNEKTKYPLEKPLIFSTEFFDEFTNGNIGYQYQDL